MPSALNKTAKSFGLGRENCSKMVIRTAPLTSKISPGPAAYNFPSLIGKGSTKFTMRIKTLSTEDLQKKIGPGPANYNSISSIDPLGKFRLSFYRDTGAPKISPASSGRWEKISIFILQFNKKKF